MKSQLWKGVKRGSRGKARKVRDDEKGRCYAPDMGAGREALREELGKLGGAGIPDWEVSPSKGRLSGHIGQVIAQNLVHVTCFKEVGSLVAQCMKLCCKPLPIAEDETRTPFSSPSFASAALPEVREPTWNEAVLQGLFHLAGSTETEDSKILRGPVVEKSVSQQLERFDMWEEPWVSQEFSEFFARKGVDYSGEEVKLAQDLVWEAVLNSLPQGVGKLDLTEFCTLGTRHYVENFTDYLVPEEAQLPVKPPRVMVRPSDWAQLCEGLVARGICGVMPLSHVHHIQGQPLLNGLFAVGKDEYVRLFGNTEAHYEFDSGKHPMC